jgi:hypothetical protein
VEAMKCVSRQGGESGNDMQQCKADSPLRYNFVGSSSTISWCCSGCTFLVSTEKPSNVKLNLLQPVRYVQQTDLAQGRQPSISQTTDLSKSDRYNCCCAQGSPMLLHFKH